MTSLAMQHLRAAPAEADSVDLISAELTLAIYLSIYLATCSEAAEEPGVQTRGL